MGHNGDSGRLFQWVRRVKNGEVDGQGSPAETSLADP